MTTHEDGLREALEELLLNADPDVSDTAIIVGNGASALLGKLRAALSASPKPAESEEDAPLREHFQRMIEACANYVEPTTYIARHPHILEIRDCKWVREFPEPSQHQSDSGKAETKRRRDQAFINDMIYMLDGPEQRAALSTPKEASSEGAQAELTLHLAEALLQHNDRLRSAMQIALRDGKDTNWLSFRGNCQFTLAEYHGLVNEARAFVEKHRGGSSNG